LALFPTLSLFLPAPSIAPESPLEDSRLVVFLSEGEGQLDSSPRMKEMPMVLDSSSSTSFFAAPVRQPPVDLFPDGKHCLPLFASTTPLLLSSASLLPPFVISSPLLAFLVSPPISFSLLPLPLFLPSALPVIASLSPGALPLSPVFVLQAPAHTSHHWSLTSKQN